MVFAEHLSINLPIFHKLLPTAIFIFAQKVFGVVPPSGVINSAGPFNRLTTGSSRAQRIICFVIMIRAKWFPVEDVEFLVRKGLMTSVTVETAFVILTLQLPIS